MLGVQPSGKTQEFSEFPYAANNLWTYVDITRTTWGFQQPKDFLLAANKIPRWGFIRGNLGSKMGLLRKIIKKATSHYKYAM